MPKIRDLSPAELEVMNILWAKGEATIRDLHGEVIKNRGHDLAYTTVATLLNRLRDKGYVSAEEQHFKYIFRPLVARKNVLASKVLDFVSRVLSGDLAPLTAYLEENRDLSAEQIKALEEIVESEGKKGAK